MKKSILFITSLVAIATLPSCAGHKVTEQKVEKEIQAVNLNTQESTQEANRNFIMNSDKLTDDQKKMLVDLQVKTNAQMSETKNEIEKLAGIESKKGLTIVPVSMYNKNRKIKVDIAIARGKREFDKRETIKKRDSDREIQRTLKGN